MELLSPPVTMYVLNPFARDELTGRTRFGRMRPG